MLRKRWTKEKNKDYREFTGDNRINIVWVLVQV